MEKDIVIPAGTILTKAPHKTLRNGNDHYSCVVGLPQDSSGSFEYSRLSEFFEDVV